MTYRLNCTYWNGSRSYFGEAYEKLEEISSKIRLEDTSAEFRMHKILGWQGDDKEIAPYYDGILRAVPYRGLCELYERSKTPENCGIYKKSDIVLYEDGTLEDLYEREIDPEKYSALADEAKRIYQYYDWTDHMSWRFQIPILYKLVAARIREFESVNYLDCDDVRVLMYTD